MKFVKSAQWLGFTLSEIGQLLALKDGMHCREASEVASARLADVRSRLACLTEIETELSALVNRCKLQGGTTTCPLVEVLQGC